MINKLAILSALPQELQPFWNSSSAIRKPNLGEKLLWQFQNNDISVVSYATGVGKVNAAAGTQFIIDHFSPDIVLFIGSAGALNQNLKIGQVVIGGDIIEYDFFVPELDIKNFNTARTWNPNSKLANLLFNVIQAIIGFHNVMIGTVLTGDQVVLGAERRNELRNIWGGDCVEMEGAAAANVCEKNNTQFALVRIISDVTNDIDGVPFINALEKVGILTSKIIANMLTFERELKEITSAG